MVSSCWILTFPSVSVVRASVGSTAVAHENGAEVRVYRGSFNIVDSTVHFTDPPKVTLELEEMQVIYHS